VSILRCLYLKLTVTFAHAVTGGGYPAMSLSEAGGHICSCQVVTILRCLYLKLTVTFALVVLVLTILRFLYLKLTVTFALAVSGGDIPALSVSEADGHICLCCVRW
jgi:hypothetical protein